MFDYEYDSEFKEKVKKQKELESTRNTFQIFLAIFFCLCFWGFWHLIESKIDILEIADVYPWEDLVLTMSPLLFFTYALAAVCNALKESSSSLFALRISAVYMFLHFTRQVLLSGSIYKLHLIVLLFLLIFLYKLFSKNTAGRLFPKNSRTIGVMGSIGIVFYSIPLVLMAIALPDMISPKSFSKKVLIENLYLKEGEVSDGLMLFYPENGWQLDSTSTREYPYTYYHYTDTISGDEVGVISSIAEYGTLRNEHIWFIHDEAVIDPQYYVSEIGNFTETIGQRVIYIDSYLYRIDYEDVRWTYGTVYYENCEKSLSVSIIDKGEKDYDTERIKSFLLSAEFDLRSRLTKE